VATGTWSTRFQLLSSEASVKFVLIWSCRRIPVPGARPVLALPLPACIPSWPTLTAAGEESTADRREKTLHSGCNLAKTLPCPVGMWVIRRLQHLSRTDW
jgi:hypothetical protein